MKKRAYLRSLGVPHVMNSRTAGFAPEVLERTAGAGVDIVLNSLAGEMIPAGLAALSRGGHFHRNWQDWHLDERTSRRAEPGHPVFGGRSRNGTE